ncbi:glycoside hydrolase family 13 protein [Nonomuraea sp. PA05]|uniref:glycoside hydrolase family 13 protein n=1 Tax=Nonomuraea sp. PA05 TaxID=2604466 RepID=UPI0011DA4D08|nr:glycoside hydrolase family 13 protein [Nonomuraea sp. PA05]TYB53176.1 glycoside hydrolase family 13 protein [Nonomuraea sp. PA05]
MTAWWRDAAIYQVYVRSFADGNGDGVGDLIGVRDRLPYLADLGVDAIWLTPFYTSPMADFGYDVADYRDVDPLFGSLADAKSLIDEAHDHGLRVIVDVVPNHTSSAHPWFQQALRGERRDRYVFRDRPNDWESIFGGPAWTQVEDGQWYLHLFDPSQPDLDWNSEEVRGEFLSILRFWLDLGVDGFRVDVAHGMVKPDGLPDIGRGNQARMVGREPVPFFDNDGVHEIHRAWRAVLDSYPGERIGVAEAWAPTPERLARYVRPDELHQAFNFHYLFAPWDAAELRTVIDSSLATAGSVGAPTTWVLSNHDVKRHVTRYGSLARARAAALLTLALPGSAYVYNGEELGLPEVLDLPAELCQDPQRLRDPDSGRDGCRVPMPWTRDGGWSDPWLPIPGSWAGLSVEAQRGVRGSTLELYRQALRLRKGIEGELVWRDSPDGTLVFSRGDLVCAVNLTATAVDFGVGGELLIASDVPGAADSAAWWKVK